MPGEVNCLFTKGLIPFVEKEIGAAGVAALCRAAGRSREYLMADHNWLPLGLANELVRVAMELTRRHGRGRLGAPLHRRHDGLEALARVPPLPRHLHHGASGDPARAVTRRTTRSPARSALLRARELGRAPAGQPSGARPCPGTRSRGGSASGSHVKWERYPTNWGLPRATVRRAPVRRAGRRRVRARGALEEPAARPAVLGRRPWPGPAASGALRRPSPRTQPPGLGRGGGGRHPAVLFGARIGYGLSSARAGGTRGGCSICSPRRSCTPTTSWRRSSATSRRTIEQLSLLSDLSAAVNATLDAEKIYEQALAAPRPSHGLPGRLPVPGGSRPRGRSAATGWPGGSRPRARSRTWSSLWTTRSARGPRGAHRAAAGGRRRRDHDRPGRRGHRPLARRALGRHGAAPGQGGASSASST